MGQRADETIGRRLGAVAVAWAAVALVWAAGWSWRDASGRVAWWLAAPALACATVSVLAMVVLLWACWCRPAAVALPRLTVSLSESCTASRTEPDEPLPCHRAIVVVAGQSATTDDLRVTLVALGLDTAEGELFSDEVVVIDLAAHADLAARGDLADVALSSGAMYRARQVDDPTGLITALGVTSADLILVLEAGDVPVAGAGTVLEPWLEDANVIAVQGVVAAGIEAALGGRGTGFITGSAALMRREALELLLPSSASRTAALWELTRAAAAVGRRVVAASGPPIVSCTQSRSDARLSAAAVGESTAAACGLLGLALGRHGPSGVQRLSTAAWATIHLEGVRRVVGTAIVLGSLLSGRLPLVSNPVILAALWIPPFLFGALSLRLLSDGALRVGDRLRASVRSLPVAIGLVLAINSVLVVRGVSDRFSHAMRPLDGTAQVALVLAALWVLAAALDSLRLLALGRRGRRAERRVIITTGSLDDMSVVVSDLTMFGAGMTAGRPLELGSRHILAVAVPSESGVTDLQLPCVVRNIGIDASGAWRLGTEFVAADAATLDTLAEWCVVTPARRALGQSQPLMADRRSARSARSQTDRLARVAGASAAGLSAAAEPGVRRGVLRAATLVALAGAISSAAPLDAAGALQAHPGPTHVSVGLVLVGGLAAAIAASLMLAMWPSRARRLTSL